MRIFKYIKIGTHLRLCRAVWMSMTRMDTLRAAGYGATVLGRMAEIAGQTGQDSTINTNLMGEVMFTK